MNGVLSYPDDVRSTDYLFRVALKAVIINDDGHMLIVKETDRDWWDTPGGGLDHGETIKEGLARELLEEVGFTGDFEYEPLHVGESHILHDLKITQIRLTFLVKPDNFNFQPGVDGDEVMFIDPESFKDSEIATERKLYEYSQLAFERTMSRAV